MEIPDTFWDWDFRRQRAWLFATLPGAPYDQIDAAHGVAIVSGLDLPREICGLSAEARLAFVNWYSQVAFPTPAPGTSLYDPWNQPADRQQEAAAIGAACQAGMLQRHSDPVLMRDFADDARAFGGSANLNAWAHSHPQSTNADAEGYLAGRALGGVSAAAHVYPAGQVATRRLHAPVRRARRRPRLSLNRTAGGRVTVLPVIQVTTPTHAFPQDQPPQAQPGYVPPSVPASVFGAPIYTPTPQPPTPSLQTHELPAVAPTLPSSGVSPWLIVGGLVAAATAGFMIYKASQASQHSRRPDRSLNGLSRARR